MFPLQFQHLPSIHSFQLILFVLHYFALFAYCYFLQWLYNIKIKSISRQSIFRKMPNLPWQAFFSLNFTFSKQIVSCVKLFQGFSEILPIQKLVKKMASVSIEKESITYDLILEKDYDEVLKMLKNTFFKVKVLFKKNLQQKKLLCILFPQL